MADEFDLSALSSPTKRFNEFDFSSIGGPAADPDRSFASEAARAIVGSLLRIPEMGVKSGEFLSKLAAPSGEEDRYRIPFEEQLGAGAKDLYQGWEPSFAGHGPAAQKVIGALSNIGPTLATVGAGIAGGPLAPYTASMAALALFGGSAGEDTYDKILKVQQDKGTPDSEAHRLAMEAATMTAMEQGGFEALTSILPLRMLGVVKGATSGKAMSEAIKSLTETSFVKPWLKETGKAMVGEVATEITQDVATELTERAYGAPPSADLTAIAKESGIGAAIITAFLSPFGLAGHFRNAKRAEAIEALLEYPTMGSKEERGAVVNMLAMEADSLGIKETADWKQQAFEDVLAGRRIRREVGEALPEEKREQRRQERTTKETDLQVKLEEQLGAVEPTDLPENVRMPTKPTPITDIVRERATAMLEVQDISSRIQMLSDQGRVVPNFLYEDLAEAKERFANAKSVAPSVEPEIAPPSAQPLDVMQTQSVSDAIRVAEASIESQAPLKNDVLVTAAALDEYITGKEYQEVGITDDQKALNAALDSIAQGRSMPELLREPGGTYTLQGERVAVVTPSELPVTSDDPMLLTRSQHEALSAVMRAEGKRVIVFRGPESMPDGFVHPAVVPGAVFVAHSTSVDPMSVGFHEVSHLMEGSPLYDSYVQTVLAEIKPGAKALAKTRHGKELSDLDLLLEISADIHGDAMRDKGFWKKVFSNMEKTVGENRAHASVLDFLDQLRDMINRVLMSIRGTTFLTANGDRFANQYVKNLEKVHDALAEAVADKYIQQGYGTINAPLEVLRVQSMQQSKKAFTPVIPAQESVAAFKGIASAQRGAPEEATLRVQSRMGSGILNPVVENVGDLIHRLTDTAHYGLAGQPYVSAKVNQAINALQSKYGFQKELNENIRNNAAYYGKDPADYRKQVYEALREYAKAYRTLPVYNELQYTAREAAAALGERRWEDALGLLKKIKTFSDMEPGEFHTKAFEAKLSGGKVLPYVDVETAGAGLLEQAAQIDQEKASARQAAEARKVQAAEVAKQREADARREKLESQPITLIGKERVHDSTKRFNRLAATLRKYTLVKGTGTNEEMLKELHRGMVDNLVWLHDLVPPSLRDRAKLWYDGANKINREFSVKYGVDENQAHAVTAVLSPQKDWFKNVSLAERTLAIMRFREFEVWSPAMTAWVESYRAVNPLDPGRTQLLHDAHRLEGKLLADLNDRDAARFVRVFDETYFERGYRTVTPEGGFLDYALNAIEDEDSLFESASAERQAVAWGPFDSIEKAVSIVRNGSDSNIARKLGKANKVQNFFQNMRDPNTEEGFVTIDTHAVAAALLRALGGNSLEVNHAFERLGVYKIMADAYRDAAKVRGILPREMQSITWEAVRALFPSSAKKTLSPKIDQIWKDYREGKISQQVARERVFALSGGIRKFMWEDGGEGLSPVQGGQSFDSTLPDELHLRKERVIAHAKSSPSTVTERNAGGDGRGQELLAFSRRAYSRPGIAGTTLQGLPSPVKVNGEDVDFQGYAPAQEAARAYMKTAGLLYEPETHYHPLNVERAKRIADAYERMEHRPDDPDVKASYRALIDEVSAQYQAMLNAGLQVEFIVGEDPYGNPRNAILDVVENNHLWVFSTEDGFGSGQTFDPAAHPMLEKTKFKISGRTALASDIFRAVHDYFGHIKEGVGFRAEGEDNAWYSHYAMFSPLARKAMTTETRGQNSWVNWGPFGETNRSASPVDTHYADQKAGLLPDWAMERDTVKSSPRMVRVEHYSREENLTTIDPAFHGTGQAGAKSRRKKENPKLYVDRSYYYLAGAQPETRFRRLHKYTTQIDANKLLDLAGYEGDITEAEANAKKDGYIGAYNSEGADPNAIMLFVPTKVRTAKASPKAAGFPSPVSYDPGQPGRWDRFVRTFQDKNIDIFRTVEAAKEAGATVPVEANPVLAEEMYHKRAEQGVTDFKTDELVPTLDLMRKNKVSLEQVDDYLHARHVIEDNLNQRLRDLDPKSGIANPAGMSDEEARKILASTDAEAMAPIVKRIDAMLDRTRALMVEYGLENEKTIAAWKEAYKYYVPLRREGFEEEGYPAGTGRSVRGSTVRTRLGSARDVSSVLANIAQAREQTVVRGERQKPVIAMAGFLMLNPNKNIATLAKPAKIQVTNPNTGLVETIPGDIMTKAGIQYRVPLVRSLDPRTGTVRWIPDLRYKGRDNVVNFRIRGEDYAIIFNEESERAMEIAKAFKNIDTPALSGFLAAVAPYTRYLASVNTQYNPIFGIINFVRDIQFASLTLSSTPLAGRQADMLKATLASLKGIYADSRAVRRGEHPASATAQLWERFQHVGGPTGYRDIFKDTSNVVEEIQRLLDPKGWKEIRTPSDFGHKMADTALFQWLSDYNQTMENAVRLGVFKVGLDAGLTDIEAASYAKNITVNFNKKGQVGAQWGALYAFFNANVQGTARILETLFDKNHHLTSVGKKIISGGILLGVLQAVTLALGGFDDDEIPEFVKQKALVIPAIGTNKGYVTIPMPLGFNLLPNIGRLAAETLIGYVTTGKGHALQHAFDLLAAIGNSFVPTGGSSSIGQELAPTVIDPILALEANKDWTGKPIYREDIDKTRPTPGFTRAKDTASAWAKILSHAVNWATGGNEYRAGLVSPSPDVFDYLIGTATGGVGRELSKTEQTIRAMVTGEDLPVYKIPVAGRFYGSAAEKSSLREQFYNNLKEINVAVNEYKARIKAKDAPSAFRLEHPEIGLGPLANALQDQISAAQKHKREMIQKGASKEAVRLQEERTAAMMKRLNDEFDRLAGR